MQARRLVPAVFAALCALSVHLTAQAPNRRDADSLYQVGIQRLRAGDTAVDFAALRMAYAASSVYEPISPTRKGMRDRLSSAVGAGDVVRARALADSLLGRTFLDIETHIILVALALQFNDTTAAGAHAAIARGLVRSLDGAHRGASAAVPIVIVTADEENAYARALRLEPTGRYKTASCGSQVCDAVVFSNPATGRDTTITFDVSLIFRHTVGTGPRKP